MFIRFVSGEIDEYSHVPAGLFCAAYELNGYLPKYEVEALRDLKKWFDLNLESPIKHLPKCYSYERAICWFKPNAREHLARAWEMVMILERHDILIWTIKSRRTGYVYYEDDAQVFAEPSKDVRLLL
jgi:hypothetical protein